MANDEGFFQLQNRGHDVEKTTVGAGCDRVVIDRDDGWNEGILHAKNPWLSAQLHPEAASGPTDTELLFDEFVKLL